MDLVNGNNSTAPARRRLLPASLLAQFMLVAGVVLVTGMLVIGLWVTSEIEEGVTDNAGAVTALYVDAIIAPVTQDLAGKEQLGEKATRALEHILRQGALRDEISEFRLWTPGGHIAYSDNPALAGRVFKPSKGLSEAFAGRVHASFDWRTKSHPGSDIATSGTVPLLEVYSPVRSATTGDIIAVAEFYTAADTLQKRLFDTRLRSWLVVGLVSIGMFSAYYIVFAQGSHTINRQRQALDEKIGQLSALLEKNRTLAGRVEQANHRIADLNERYLRRISAELHDGPAQLLAFAALRLEHPETARQEQVHQAINEAIQEIRYICRGLALPELEGWSVATIVKRVVSMHESRTGSRIATQLDPDLPEVSLAARTCIYRFIQETLNNGFKHAQGARQEIFIRSDCDGIEVEVRDNGAGFDPQQTSEGLGLDGLRARVAGLKGEFMLHSQQGAGTRVIMRIPAHGEAEAT